MNPTIESDRLKYLADCLLNVNRDAPAQLGEDVIRVLNKDRTLYITIENENGGHVIDTANRTIQGSDLRKGLFRYRGPVTFSEDGSEHTIGDDVTARHKDMVYETRPLQIESSNFDLHATISDANIRTLASSAPKDSDIIIQTQADGHYIGVIDNLRIYMRGNIVPGANYTMVMSSYVRQLAKIVKGSVEVDWMHEGAVRFRWTAYGLRVSYYIGPRIINDTNLIERLSRRVIL